MVTIHENVVLIECEDDLALEELAGAADLEACVVRRLSSRAVLVDPEAVDGLLQKMQRKGYTPRVLTAGGTPRTHPSGGYPDAKPASSGGAPCPTDGA